MQTLLKNATLVLADRVVEQGSLLVHDGLIQQVCPDGQDPMASVHDCQGHWLIPGLVDLHCDVIEKDVEVRRDVHIPMELSIREADRRNASSGITTQFHGISFGHAERGLRDDIRAGRLAQTIRQEAGNLLVDNRILLRCELSSETAQERIAGLLNQGIGDLVSFMDHSPSSGTYSQILEAWRAQVKPESFPGLFRMMQLIQLCQTQGIPMGSHDDDSLERLQFLADLGVGISEFPKTMEVATAAIRLGLHTVVGGPNAVRGGSHLNWLAAADAIQAGVASAICSDYHPTILPQAIFKLHQQGVASLPEIVACVTRKPALAAGLVDRGVLETGMRADLVEIACDQAGWARVVSCWSRGRLVCSFPDIPRIVSAHSSNAHQKLTDLNLMEIQA